MKKLLTLALLCVALGARAQTASRIELLACSNFLYSLIGQAPSLTQVSNISRFFATNSAVITSNGLVNFYGPQVAGLSNNVTTSSNTFQTLFQSLTNVGAGLIWNGSQLIATNGGAAGTNGGTLATLRTNGADMVLLASALEVTNTMDITWLGTAVGTKGVLRANAANATGTGNLVRSNTPSLTRLLVNADDGTSIASFGPSAGYTLRLPQVATNRLLYLNPLFDVAAVTMGSGLAISGGTLNGAFIPTAAGWGTNTSFQTGVTNHVDGTFAIINRSVGGFDVLTNRTETEFGEVGIVNWQVMNFPQVDTGLDVYDFNTDSILPVYGISSLDSIFHLYSPTTKIHGTANMPNLTASRLLRLDSANNIVSASFDENGLFNTNRFQTVITSNGWFRLQGTLSTAPTNQVDYLGTNALYLNKITTNLVLQFTNLWTAGVSNKVIDLYIGGSDNGINYTVTFTCPNPGGVVFKYGINSFTNGPTTVTVTNGRAWAASATAWQSNLVEVYFSHL